MQTVGKFEIERILGRGAHAVVYLASDPVLRRPVALKLMQPRHGDRAGAGTTNMLDEARACGQLRHPHIVPVYEAGESSGRPYLAFEYVDGQTLASLLREHGPVPAARAAQMLIGILEALQHAHDAGLVHRDLKPSNILVARDGTPRVTDFGIASRITGAADSGALSGTPAYMAPEYIRDRIVSPQGDVFAAGLVLVEMLTGKPAVAADNPFQAMHSIANVPLSLPQGIDQALTDILAKATARDPQLRFATARQMRDALQAYIAPAATATDERKSRASTLEFLLRRMRQKSDFPAMSAAISTINRLAASSESSAAQLAATILKDFALTNKILRLANSAYYPQTQGARISTVSRAVVVLGFDTVRSIAISLMLFEHMQDKNQARRLRDELLGANLAGMLARELAAAVGAEPEQAFICGLFHNLGRLLARYYLHEEAEAIERLLATGPVDETQASRRILGLSYEELGTGVARTWEFPEGIVRSMQRPPTGALRKPDDADTAMSLLSACASELAALCAAAAPDGSPAQISPLVERFGTALSVGSARLESAMEQSLQRLRELADALGIDLGQSAFGTRAGGAGRRQAELRAAIPGIDQAVPAAAPHADEPAEAILAAGVQDLTQALIEDAGLDDLLRIVAETMFRAIGCQRALVCIRDAASGQMRARLGLGAGVPDALARFRFATGGADLFNVILGRNVDILIADAGEPKVRRHLPDWFLQHFNAASFIVLPISLRGTPAAMLYADHGRPGGIRLSEKELALLRTLRNQVVLALKQSPPPADTSSP